jgi:hypothetical protein
LSKQAGVRITRIGACVPATEGISVLDRHGKKLKPPAQGHDHFRRANATHANRRNRLMN